MAEKIIIAELNIDNSALLKSTTAIRAEIDKLKASQKELDKTTEQGRTQFVKNEASLKTLSKEYRNNQKAMAQRVKVTQDAKVQEELLKSVLDKEVNSITEAREQTKILTQIRNDANVNTKEGAELVEKLNKQLDRNKDFVNNQADAYLKSKINIGRYKESVLEAFEEIDANKKVLEEEIKTLEQLRKETKKGSDEWLFYGEKIKENEKQMDTLTGSMRGMNNEASASSSLTQLLSGDFKGLAQSAKEAGGASKLAKQGFLGATSGIWAMIKASVAFIATPIGLVAVSIGAAFVLIKNAMNRSEESTKKITKLFAGLSGIFNRVLKALEPLGTYLIDYLVEYFNQLGEAADKAGQLISDGLEFLGFDEASKSVDKFNKSIKQSAKDAQVLADAEAKLVVEQRKSQKIQLEYQNLAEKQRQIRDDVSKSDKERIDANTKLGEILKKQTSEELAIANLGLKVSNLRIEKIGKTKEALDQQAEAETNIADIKERINGQESEQLTNTNSLRKEANDKQIARLQGELELFIASQGVKARTLAEELELSKQVSVKKVEILKKELANKNITRSKYDAELQTIQNEQAKQQAEIAVESAKIELDAYVQTNQSKIDSDKFFSEESLRIEQERLQGIADQQTTFAQTQLEQGVINLTEYNARINEIDEENRVAKEEAQNTRDEAKKEKEVVDLANKLEIEEEQFQTQFELDTFRLEQQRIAEVESADKSGADIDLINQKYAESQKKIDEAKNSAIISDTANTFGQIASILGKGSALGKAAAITQTTIAGYQATMNAYTTAQKSPITLVNPAYPLIQAGLAGAFGVAQVAKVAGVKFRKGGIASIDGASHEMGGVPIYAGDKYIGEAEGGEGIGILNKSAFADFMGYNNSFNSDASTSSKFAGGGIITQAVSNNNGNNSDIADQITDAMANMNISVAVEDINTGQSNFAEVKNEATLG